MQNVTTIHSLTSSTEQGQHITTPLGWTICHCPRAGIDSVEKLEVKWLIHVSTTIIVVRGFLAGLTEHTLQWLMGLFNAECVSILVMGVVVIIQLTSVFVTVGRFTFINLTESIITYVTVATDLYLQHQVREDSSISLAHYSVKLLKRSLLESLKAVFMQLSVQ